MYLNPGVGCLRDTDRKLSRIPGEKVDQDIFMDANIVGLPRLNSAQKQFVISIAAGAFDAYVIVAIAT